MKQNTKNFLGNLFLSLISNNRVLDGARTAPLFVAIIMLLVGNFLPVIPIMVSTARSYGSSFLSGNTYNLDVSLTQQTKEISNSYQFKLDDDYQLLAYDDSGNALNRTQAQEETPLVEHYVNSFTHQIDLEIYYVNRPETSKDKSVSTVKDLVEKLEERTFKQGTDTTYTKANADDTTLVYKPSFIVLYPKGLLMALHKENSVDLAGNSSSGLDWKHFETGTDLLKPLLSVKDENDANIAYNIRDSKYTEGVLTNWREVFNKAYLNARTFTFWTTSSMFYGVYVALTIIMGLLIFVLTRGKRNPYSYLKFITCESIEAWACVSPALIGLIVGLIAPNYAVVGYIMLLGLRTVWLTMKQLRPQYQ